MFRNEFSHFVIKLKYKMSNLMRFWIIKNFIDFHKFFRKLSEKVTIPFFVPPCRLLDTYFRQIKVSTCKTIFANFYCTFKNSQNLLDLQGFKKDRGRRSFGYSCHFKAFWLSYLKFVNYFSYEIFQLLDYSFNGIDDINQRFKNCVERLRYLPSVSFIYLYYFTISGFRSILEIWKSSASILRPEVFVHIF